MHYDTMEMELKRDFDLRVIVVIWRDIILGWQLKSFPFSQEKECMEFASKKFKETSM